MDAPNPRDVVLAFVGRINARDVDGMCSLMSEDHLFVDSLGAKVRGRDAMRRAWLGYFHMVPDFSIEVFRVLADGPVVGLFGRSEGTFSPDGVLNHQNHWEMPSAWRAIVRECLVAEWQVYADNEPVRLLMVKHKP